MNIFGNAFFTAIFFSVVFAIISLMVKIMSDDEVDMKDIAIHSGIALLSIIGSLAAYKPKMAETFSAASAPF